MRRISLCCARAASGHAAAEPHISFMNSRRCMSVLENTHYAIAKAYHFATGRRVRNGTQLSAYSAVEVMSALGHKRTWEMQLAMSAMGQQRTLASKFPDQV
jgi:uncharacterized protein YchJ